jgi:hypothetical protein
MVDPIYNSVYKLYQRSGIEGMGLAFPKLIKDIKITSRSPVD